MIGEGFESQKEQRLYRTSGESTLSFQREESITKGLLDTCYVIVGSSKTLTSTVQRDGSLMMRTCCLILQILSLDLVRGSLVSLFIATNDKSTKFRYRICPGRHIADRIGFGMISSIVSLYDILPLDGEERPKSAEYIDAALR
jgi:hypothetical protein